MPKSKVRKKPDNPVRMQSIAPSQHQVNPSPAWYPIVMAVVVLSSAMLLASYILRDIAYGVADPRIRRI